MQPFSSSTSQSSALAPWEPPADQSYRDLMSDVVEPIKEPNPSLLWMTGKLPTSDRQVPVGWHVHKGVNPALDELLARLKYKHHQIEHQSDQNGEAELVEYWSLNYRWDQALGAYLLVPVSLVVIARGVPDKRQMKDSKNRHGVAYGWEINRQKDGSIILKDNGEPKRTARLKLRAYIHELLPAPNQAWEETNGFLQWFQASISGYLVDDMLGVLYSQYRAMRAYDSNQVTTFKTPYWGLSNPIIPASSPRRVGTKDGQATSIVPMRSLIPANEAEISEKFLLQHRIPPALQQELLEGEVLLDTWAWSVDESEYIEGIKPRPIGARSSQVAPPIAGVVVTEEHPTAPSPAPVPSPLVPEPEPRIDAAQQQVLVTLLAQDQAAVQTLCQRYQVRALSDLMVSQFRQILLDLSQPR